MRQSCADTLATEEPDELIAHVRVCGGAGWVTIGSTRKRTGYTTGFFQGRVSVACGPPLTAGVRRLREWKRRNQEWSGGCRHGKEKERLDGSRRIGGTQYGRFGLHQKLRRKAQEGAGRTESKGESVGVQRPVVHY